MKRVLFIAYHFPPLAGGGTFRSLKFVKYLPEFGWLPTVLTTNTKNYWAYDETLLKEVPENVKIIRAGELDPFNLQVILSKIGLGKLYQKIKDRFFIPDEKIGWIPIAYRKAVKEFKKQKYDLIFSTSPTPCAHIIAMKLAKRFNIPWVCDFRDFWTRHPYYKYKNKRRNNSEIKIEESIINTADHTICAFMDIIQRWPIKYREKLGKTFHVIYNGFDDEYTFKNTSVKNSNNMTITYTGSYYGSYNPLKFLEAFEQLKLENNDIFNRIQFQFIGNIERKIIESIHVRELGIIIKSFMPQIKLSEEIKNSDILLLIMPEKSQLPGKLFSYMIYQKPIFAVIPECETKEILKKSNLGFFADPNSPDDIKKQVLHLYHLWETGQLHVEPNTEYIRQFHRRNLTKQLAKIFNQQRMR